MYFGRTGRAHWLVLAMQLGSGSHEADTKVAREGQDAGDPFVTCKTSDILRLQKWGWIKLPIIPLG